MSLLQNVDPNPENFVCAGIIKGSSVQMGTLLRLEPNRQGQVSIHLSDVSLLNQSSYEQLVNAKDLL